MRGQKSKKTTVYEFLKKNIISGSYRQAFGNRRLLAFYKGLKEHVERFRLFYFSNQNQQERAAQSFAEHA